MFDYTKNVLELIEKAEKVNRDAILELSQLIEKTIVEDKIIHCFGTGHGHMPGIELFGRAGGLGNVDAMVDPDCIPTFGARRSCAIERTSGVADVVYDSYKIEQGDIMIITSNSGRNAMIVEMALRCRKEGIKVIAITNLNQSKNQASRHSSGMRLIELADVVIDTCVPVGDVSLVYDGVETGPVSSIMCMYLLNTCVAEAVKNLTEKGIKPLVFKSQNVDGNSNDEIYSKYEGRIKHY